MSKTEHTRGPWKITRRWADGKRIIIEGDPEEWARCEIHVVSDDCDYDTAEANARLVVAAPDLLEACEWIWDIVGTARDGGDAWCAVREQPGAKKWFDTLKVAIAKTKEEQA